MSEAKIFLTDYASYNEGLQFKHGHWVDLDQFSDGEEVSTYISDFLERITVEDGELREEPMITDYEGFPRSLYSESGMDYDALMEYLNLEDQERHAVEYMTENLGYKLKDTFDKAADLVMTENCDDVKYQLFENWYPNAEEIEQSNDYVSIDYDRFLKENFTAFTAEDGTKYWVQDNQF